MGIMSHSITDSEGKLHKIAGNFNPSYEVSQLVAEKTITDPTTLIEMNGLDINRDGGVYDFILITSNTASQFNNMHITINNYNLARYYSEICDFNGNSVASSQLFGTNAGYLGVISQNNGFSIGSITLMKNIPLYEIRNFSLQGTARTVTVNGGYYENTSNITSIQFKTDYGFTAGTTVKIYKRMANATISKSSGFNIETIYDMTSSDSSINWGYTSGIQSGTAVVNTKMKNYHFLDVVAVMYPNGSTNTGGHARIFRIDLLAPKPYTTEWQVAGYACAYSDAAVAGYVNKETWNIVLLYNTETSSIQCRCSFNGSSYTSNSNVYISKIYGVN